MGGKATLINSILCSMPMYILAVTKMPKDFLLNMDKMITAFIWNNHDKTRHHWIGWKTIQKKKNEGGLGIKSCKEMSFLLQHKFVWTFVEGRTPWARFMQSKYGLGDRKMPGYASHIWTMIKPKLKVILDKLVKVTLMSQLIGKKRTFMQQVQ